MKLILSLWLLSYSCLFALEKPLYNDLSLIYYPKDRTEIFRIELSKIEHITIVNNTASYSLEIFLKNENEFKKIRISVGPTKLDWLEKLEDHLKNPNNSQNNYLRVGYKPSNNSESYKILVADFLEVCKNKVCLVHYHYKK